MAEVAVLTVCGLAIQSRPALMLSVQSALISSSGSHDSSLPASLTAGHDTRTARGCDGAAPGSRRSLPCARRVWRPRRQGRRRQTRPAQPPAARARGGDCGR
eukprot:3667475-Prymnesium_polylepis.1